MQEVTAASRAVVGRRAVLTGATVGATGLALAACSTGGPAQSATTTATLGSYNSDPAPKAGTAAEVAAFEKKTKNKITINTVDHNSFQNKINNYLAGSPDDVFTWFAGYRMRYYADKGLVAPIDDVWDKIKGNFGAGLQSASTGDDGHKYIVPTDNYPWGFFYRKSLWKDKGYVVPTTYDQLEALCKQMTADGLIPIGFADKDAWPACGTFDMINMRVNGYKFHIDLCAHKESWNSPKLQEVFDTWKILLPYHDPSALGATWQDAAGKLGAKKSGMYLLGSFVTSAYTDQTITDDIDFFPYPSIKVEGQDAIEAPIDGYMLSKRGGTNSAAKAFLEFMGTAEGQEAFFKSDSSNLMTASDADRSTYTDLNKKCATAIADAKYIAQFFDRDALPAMATNVLEPALQQFFSTGKVDLVNIEAQAKTLYASA